MTPADSAPSFRVLQEAAEWFAVLRAPAVPAGERQRWRQWHDADPAHQLAWRRVEAISGKFEDLPGGDKPTAHRLLDAVAAKRAQRRRAVKMLALLCGTGLGTWAATQSAPWRAWTAAHHTGVGERREIRLADGATLWLNTDSAIDIDYGPQLRRVKLLAGEILVSTAPDTQSPARPFVVDTAEARLRALGTRYAVHQEDGASTVAVFDGAVEVRPLASGAEPLIVRAGQQSRVTRNAATAPAPADLARESWSRGLLIAENMRLGDFIAEVSRYRRGYLACAPEVADLRIVGAYALADTDRVLAALADTLPVRIQATMPWWVTVVPR
ncbi:FecR domain-containing protein [Achromobacter spanius]|uniref:FecR domain-containing protein n=1 Tax=Achromobacter spanius TaxID=217203 RepID=UPI00320A406B